MSTLKLINHLQVETLLLDIAEILELAGAHFIVTRELARRLKNNEWFDNIDKIRIIVPSTFMRDSYAKDIILTMFQKYNIVMSENKITFNHDGIDVTIKFLEPLHKTLVDPDYVNVLGEKIPIPNPFNEYLKVQNFI